MSNETRQRYWCHICNAEVNIYMAPEPTCQQCNEQFIEELQIDDDPREFLAGTDNHTHTGEERGGGIHIHDGGAHIFSSGRMSGEMGDDIFQYFTPNNTTQQDEPSTEGGGNNGNNPPLGNLLQNLLTNMLGENVQLINANVVNDGETNRTPRMYVGSMVDGNVRFQPMPGMMPEENNENNNNNTEENGGTGTTGGGAAAGARGNSIASIMQFLSAMTGAPIDGGLVGNPNDYVFSQNALDNIITQLMEQTGGASAPPPAPEQVIESLAKRPLTDEEKSTETDCAVCKDQFEPHEMVIELPCEHIFHDDCIKPWLKLNGTCPVCRHSVLPEQENNNTDNNDSNNNNNTQNTTTNETRSETTNNNNNDNNTTTTTAAWISGTGSNGTAQWPLNLSAAFPSWANRPNTTNNNNTTLSNTTTNTTSNTHIDEDLDLD